MTASTKLNAEPHTLDQRTADLENFTYDYFQTLGAEVRRQTTDDGEMLHVSLPETLTTHFGRTELTVHYRHSRRTTATWLPTAAHTLTVCSPILSKIVR